MTGDPGNNSAAAIEVPQAEAFAGTTKVVWSPAHGPLTVTIPPGTVDGAIVWPNCRISRDASVRHAIVGRNCHLGRNVTLTDGAILGDKTTLTDYTKA